MSKVASVTVAALVAGEKPIKSACDLDVVAIDPAAIQVDAISVDLAPAAKVDETLSQDDLNDVAVGLYFGPSIAAIGQLQNGTFVTSVGRPLALSIGKVEPAGFAPLMEWRVDGVATQLGVAIAETIHKVGLHSVSAGPPASATAISLETYAVTISPIGDAQQLPDGSPLLFVATTEPRGHEQGVTWLAATKYGAADIVLGQGPTLVVEFSDTWGPRPDGQSGLWRWLGVKADDAVFGKDAKVDCGQAGGCCQPHSTPGCESATCCEITCVFDAYCCTVEWDVICVQGAAGEDACACAFSYACGAGGGCLVESSQPGCADAACCASICGLDVFCCLIEWDGWCADAASAVCATSACPGAGSCFAPGPQMGCEQEACCAAVCALDSFCCQIAWDALCVAIATALPDTCFQACPCPPWPTLMIVNNPGANFTTPQCDAQMPQPKFMDNAGAGYLCWGKNFQTVGVTHNSTKTTVKLVPPPGQPTADAAKCCKKCRVGFVQNLLTQSRVATYGAANKTTTIVWKDTPECMLPLNDREGENGPPWYSRRAMSYVTGKPCNVAFDIRMADLPGDCERLRIDDNNLTKLEVNDTYVTWLVLQCPDKTGPLVPIYHWHWRLEHNYDVTVNSAGTGGSVAAGYKACATVIDHAPGQGDFVFKTNGPTPAECAKKKHSF